VSFVYNLAQARTISLSKGFLSPEREPFSLSENWVGTCSIVVSSLVFVRMCLMVRMQFLEPFGESFGGASWLGRNSMNLLIRSRGGASLYNSIRIQVRIAS